MPEGSTGVDIGAALTSAQTEIMSGIGEALPIAAVVFASLAGIRIAFKFFKNITGARA